MNYTRRDFIKQFSVMLASLVVTGCVPESVSAPAAIPASPTSTPKPKAVPTIPPCSAVSGATRPHFDWDTPHRADWDMLRECWLYLADVHEDSNVYSWDSAHQDSLDALIEAGEIDAIVADKIHAAFVAAAHHIQRSRLQATCYYSGPPASAAVSGVLYGRLYTLYETADDLDPETVEQARVAITRDLAFTEAVNAERWGDDLWDAWQAGKLEASPEAIEAACILVDLILGEGR